MKHLLIAVAMIALYLQTLNAQEEHHDSKTYVVLKALYSLGEKVDHGHGVTLESDPGAGIGIDVGYKLFHNLAVEFDFSYDENNVEENDNGHKHTVDGTYYTYALDLVYMHHLTDSIELIAKLGAELEDEQIKELGIDTTETGLAYGVGVEYILNHHYDIVLEYEGSTIDSPRGHSIFAGIKYNF